MQRWSVVIALVLLAAGAALGIWAGLRPPAVQVTRPTRGPAVDAVYATGNVGLPMRRLGQLDETAQRERAVRLLRDLGLAGHGHKYPSQQIEIVDGRLVG